MNISSPAAEEYILADLFSLLGNPSRLLILLLLGEGEACVCHLKEALGQRQAYISQQLMILRKAGLVSTSRNGRHVYYRLARPELLEVVRETSRLHGMEINLPAVHGTPGCPYPASTGKF